jgi:hypothetical protein
MNSIISNNLKGILIIFAANIIGNRTGKIANLSGKEINLSEYRITLAGSQIGSKMIFNGAVTIFASDFINIFKGNKVILNRINSVHLIFNIFRYRLQEKIVLPFDTNSSRLESVNVSII